MSKYGYMPNMISKSHFNRRLHRIEPTLWRVLFEVLAQAFKKRNNPELQTYVVDSLPVAVCDNIRIRRCRLYPLEEAEGTTTMTMTVPLNERRKVVSRLHREQTERYFYGLRVHLVVTAKRESRWSSLWRRALRPR
jgi:hypothetical protein